MKYDEIWRRLARRLDAQEAKAVSRMLLEDKFGMTYADILCGGVESLSASDEQWLASALERIEASEPVQYVLGEALFCDHRFTVGKGVLIPRPETEWLVERACRIAAVRGADALRILDIGTGSGCIAVSLKKSLPDAYVEAWDISPDALAIAEGNARSLGADVVFNRRDVLNIANVADCWDIIISNPPYICDSERRDMDANVLDHEPSVALFVPDSDPLLFYRAITAYASDALRAGGWLLFECNTQYAGDTAALQRDRGFADVCVVDDCFGKPRFTEAKKP